MSETKRLYRSTTDRMIGGVCSGLATYLGIDPMLVRLAFGVLALVNGLGILIYMIMWFVVPDENSRGLTGEDLVRANLDDMGRQARDLGGSLSRSHQGGVIVGVLLVAAGVIFLAHNFIPWLNAGFLWPIALIALGAYLLFGRRLG